MVNLRAARKWAGSTSEVPHPHRTHTARNSFRCAFHPKSRVSTENRCFHVGDGAPAEIDNAARHTTAPTCRHRSSVRENVPEPVKDAVTTPKTDNSGCGPVGVGTHPNGKHLQVFNFSARSHGTAMKKGLNYKAKKRKPRSNLIKKYPLTGAPGGTRPNVNRKSARMSTYA
ncbi:hypothetical protein EVAR_39091_1 [Eumeta japonica]|uniref:Uncharacterized protein n=1 Tax=Eumeta variegata TaxID=151549 RepID=A0A4C1WMD5_EUMVA|nr:hypothetical protein EVAR_39091_1 [Eumeta japonica]